MSSGATSTTRIRPPLTYFLARSMPAFGWTFFQYVTLAYEVGAPLWFAMQPTRLPALFVGLGMHAADRPSCSVPSCGSRFS